MRLGLSTILPVLRIMSKLSRVKIIMAERIPRPIVPRTAVSVPSVGNIRVQTAGRLDGIPRPVTSRLEPPEIRTALPPVTTNLQPPTVRTPELGIHSVRAAGCQTLSESRSWRRE